MKSQNLLSMEALDKFSDLLSFDSEILDIGSGEESHSNILRSRGFSVDTCDFHDKSTYKGNFNDLKIEKKYDGIWSSHCLEHQLNVNFYLKKLISHCKEGGLICVTVPPLKHMIVGGHVNLWNPGLLLYNFIIAGIDCSDCKIKQYGYNISLIVKKKSITLPEITFSGKDLETLKNFFPKSINWKNVGNRIVFDGNFLEINWK